MNKNKYKKLSEEDDLTLLKECRSSVRHSLNNIATITFIILLFHFGYVITAWFVIVLGVLCFIGEMSLPSKLVTIKKELKKRGFK